MYVAGIIAEYNPFHHGHMHQIAQTRAAGASHVIAVMSGAAVQRGAFAIADKWARAQMAVSGGVDLVVCLPAPWSCARAQDFARGAVEILSALGCVDLLSFGSECGDADLLRRAASLVESRGVRQALKTELGQGRGFAAARECALASVDSRAARCLQTPNDTLAVEYLQAMEKIGVKWAVQAVARVGAGHDCITGEHIKSASELRKIILAGELQPNDIPFFEALSKEIAAGRIARKKEELDFAMLARMKATTLEAFADLPDLSEGVDRRLLQAARQAGSLEELLSCAKVKRYTYARLRRAVFHCFISINREIMQTRPEYIEILAFSARGQELLHHMKANQMPKLPFVHRKADVRKLSPCAQSAFALEERVENLQKLLFGA